MRTPKHLVGIGALGLLLPLAIGCTPATNADNCPPLALAFVGALSGPSTLNGEIKRNGAVLAVAEHNERADVCEIGLISFDSQGDTRQVIRMADQIVADTQIIGVVGPVFSGETREAMPIFEGAGLAVVSPSATNDQLSLQGWSTFHRVIASDAPQSQAAAAWIADELSARRVAVVGDLSLYGEGLAELVATALAARNVRTVVRESVDIEVQDYRAQVANIVAADVDAIFYGGRGDPGTRLYRQVRDAGVDAWYIGGDGLLIDAFERAAAGDPRVTVTCPCVSRSRSPQLDAFAEQYQETFGLDASNYAAEGFDAAGVLLAGIDAGARTRQDLATWLDTVEYDGLTKTITFTDTGDIAGGIVYLFGVTTGQYRAVATFQDDTLTPASSP
jgi:branched-chain amino acid transport system substrate-binding protein